MAKLRLTYSELEDIVQGEYDRFEILTGNKLPTKYHFSTYSKNGDIFKGILFKDKDTNEKYYIEYSFHTEHGYDFPNSIQTLPKNIEFVSQSILHPNEDEMQPEEESFSKEIEPLSENEMKLKRLSEEYFSVYDINETQEDFDSLIVTFKRIDLNYILNAMSGELFNYNELMINLHEIAIKYKVGKGKLFDLVKGIQQNPKKFYKEQNIRINKITKQRIIDNKPILKLKLKELGITQTQFNELIKLTK